MVRFKQYTKTKLVRQNKAVKRDGNDTRTTLNNKPMQEFNKYTCKQTQCFSERITVGVDCC